MINKEWILSDTAAGVEKLVLVGHNFLEPDFGGKITVYLRKIFTDANGVERSNVNADYAVEKGKISYDVDGNALPKKNIDGTFVYVKDEEGNDTDEIAARDNGYENIVHYVDNKIMSIYELIDAGVVEKFNIPT